MSENADPIMARAALTRLRAAWIMAALTVATAWASGCTSNPAAPGTGGGPGTSVFSWTITPSVTAQPGAAGTFTIRLDSKANINSDVSFSLSGTLPPNSTAAFIPERLTSTARDATLTIQTTSRTPLGRYEMAITATENGYGQYTRSVQLDVEDPAGPPDFELDVDPADITLTRGGSVTVNFLVWAVNGFTGTVNVALDGIEVPPAPVQVVSPPSPNQITLTTDERSRYGTVVLRLAERPSYPRRWTLSLRAVDGRNVHTRTINITLNPG